MITKQLHPRLWFLTFLFIAYWIMAVVDVIVIHGDDSEDIWDHVEQSWEFVVGYNESDDEEEDDEADSDDDEHALVLL